MVFAIDPRIPPNWTNIALDYEWSGPDLEWARAARSVIERHGPRSIVLEEVQALVLRATGISPHGWLRSHEGIAQIPQSEWSIRAAWGEPSRRPFKPGSLWNAAQEIRSVDDELTVLHKLQGLGFSVLQEERAPGMPDWSVRSSDGQLYVEVKSKGPDGASFDFLQSALDGVLLLDHRGGLRQCDWHLDSPSNEAGLLVWSAGERRLDALVDALLSVAEEVSDWVFGRLPGFEERRGFLESLNVRFRAWCCQELLGLEFVDGASGGEFTFYGRMRNDPARLWVFHPGRSKADWELPRLGCRRLRHVVRILDRSLLKAGPNRGRQLQRFPEETLYFLCWHAPIFWDTALRTYPDDINRLVELLTRRVAKFRKVGLAVWAMSFTDSLVANDRAQLWLNE